MSATPLTINKGKLIGADRLPRYFAQLAANGVTAERLAFVCIGTDRSTGDALGPLVGTMLREAGYRRVIGALEEPCDADTMPRMLERLESGWTTLAIDACLGKPASVGCYQVGAGGLVPGAATGRGFAPIGDYAVAAIVGELTDAPYKSLQRASLHCVMGMARTIASAIGQTFEPV